MTTASTSRVATTLDSAARCDRTHTPLAVFRDDKNKPRYISNRDVEQILQHAAKKVHNITKAAELSQWSCHSVRVGACIRLQLLNKPDHFIQMRLRWTSEAWKDYLRNLPELADAQNKVINALAEEVRTS